MCRTFFLWILCVLCFQSTIRSQSETSHLKIKEMEAEIALRTAQLDSIKSSLTKFKEEIRTFPYWKMGMGGILGMDVNRFSNWAGRGEYHNSSSAAISTTLNAKAHLIGKDFFWRNIGRVTLAWNKLEVKGDEEHEGFHKTADVINVNTHLGNKLNDDIAVSMFSEWKSNLLSQSLSPSYLDWSVGVTWTPVEEIFAVMHPVNYELVLSEREQFESSLGAKMVVEYDHQLTKNLEVKSHLAGFMSYENIEELTNYTWTNSLNLKVLDSVGFGIEYALRVSPQETAALTTDEDVQSYVIMGVSYMLP